jgi:hypothetical protein
MEIRLEKYNEVHELNNFLERIPSSETNLGLFSQDSTRNL